MKKEEPKTDFRFSYAALEQLGDKADDLMGRDATELADYGIDADYRLDVETRTEAFKDYPTDDELLGEASTATEDRDRAADLLRIAIRGMMVRVKHVFKPGTATYKGFGTKQLDEITDNDLVRCGKRVVRLATAHIGKLSVKGVNPVIIAALGDATSVLDDAIDAKDTAIRVRNEGTQERVEMANALYNIIVELFDFGKDHWYTRNEAKYNDYIIYNTPGGGAEPDPDPPSYTVKGKVVANSTANIVNDLNPTALVQVSNTGLSQFVVCTTANSTDVCSVDTTVQPNETVTLGGPSNTNSSGLGQYLNITNNDPLNDADYDITVTG